ncbi:3-dehydroquinate synthase [Natronincola ferrireducens]|uniref:3-dehydroquinate synthase n=1 Tax=Natronincola ferrireducens TaxID=393762 RepID=A0A1G8Y3V6_9FIRM|nr:3-dehydroquinate synthase [Natronincola ferrireducens]SDJ96730.1 3-dehydroquinate synthase [Natronincola ferrireducens]
MERLYIDLGENSYWIHIARGLIENLKEYLTVGDKFLLITDENVDSYYGEKILKAFKGKEVEKVVLPPGETTKNLSVIEGILNTMIDRGFTRRSQIIAVGGGVIGDIAGFCASIYMRGIDFIQVPTTLLAQVDSSVGGKTGVNMPQAKNIVGSFYQPKAVVIDTDVLRTLPPRELISGIGEVIKYGIIYDGDFLDYIDAHLPQLLKLDEDIMPKVIKGCCEIKAEIVAKDEREVGLRKILNFGHTIGHSLEALTQYKKYTHGEAVLMGMYYETLMAKKLGYIDEVYCDEIAEIIQKTGISLELQGITLSDLIGGMMKDKKNHGGKISFILPIGKGKVEEVLLTREKIENIFFSLNK